MFIIKLACLKCPDGLMIGIFESNDDTIDEDDYSPDLNIDAKLDPATAEIKNLLDKFKL